MNDQIGDRTGSKGRHAGSELRRFALHPRQQDQSTEDQIDNRR
jgi:hypothetical protein